jgi:serine protease DegQ
VSKGKLLQRKADLAGGAKWHTRVLVASGRLGFGTYLAHDAVGFGQGTAMTRKTSQVGLLTLGLVVGYLSIGAGVAAWPFGSVHEDPLPTLAPLLRETTPAVVNVSVIGTPAAQPHLSDPPAGPQQRQHTQQSIGSGVIINADRGLILTNRHVVANAGSIAVILADKRRFSATLVGSDRGTDIALLTIPPRGLHAIPIGNSDDLRVGDFVVAIGNPFGLGQTATSGIVSALGRSGLNVEGYEDFIQTDASINPGNSGGALVDLGGNLIGINTAIISPAGGNVGIGFAIPSNMVRNVVQQLLEYGEVRRGKLGILIQDVTPALAEALTLEVDHGAVITQIQDRSPADAAGLQVGDVIIAVDGRAIASSANLRNEIGLVRLGETVHLVVLRDGRRQSVSARVGDVQVAAASLPSGQTIQRLPGAELIAVGPGPEGPAAGKINGVLVLDVGEGTRSWNSGLRPSDIILGVNRSNVGSVSALSDALEASGSPAALRVSRGEQNLFIVVE